MNTANLKHFINARLGSDQSLICNSAKMKICHLKESYLLKLDSDHWFEVHAQELMSGEAAKERVTPVPSKSGLLTYFRFGEAQCASCGLSPTLGHAAT